MQQLDPQQRELVALGAALGSSCIPCLAYHVGEARRQGLTEAQIREALEIADVVRSVPARAALATAQAQLSETPAAATPECCEGGRSCE